MSGCSVIWSSEKLPDLSSDISAASALDFHIGDKSRAGLGLRVGPRRIFAADNAANTAPTIRTRGSRCD
jgi:hypothetical protein